MTCMYMCMHVCACMFAPRCRARFTLYGHEDRDKLIERITWRVWRDIERGDVQPICPIASLPGSARHEGE